MNISTAHDFEAECRRRERAGVGPPDSCPVCPRGWLDADNVCVRCGWLRQGDGPADGRLPPGHRSSPAPRSAGASDD